MTIDKGEGSEEISMTEDEWFRYEYLAGSVCGEHDPGELSRAIWRLLRKIRTLENRLKGNTNV